MGREVGCLGDIVFSISDEQILTLNNLQWSGAATYGTHQRHLNNALTEFTGLEPDKISLDIELSYWFGNDVQGEINKIWKYEREGTPVRLNIGTKGYGKYRWNVVSHTITGHRYHGNGDLAHCTVSVQLVEYLLS